MLKNADKTATREKFQRILRGARCGAVLAVEF